jgi:deoxyribodipyrimidine photolyase
MACTLLWFRRDLRLRAHPALVRAAQRGFVIPAFILDPNLLHHPETGSARVGFMLECLRSLDEELRQWGVSNPIALPLEDLDQVQAAQLRTWFTAHVEIKSHNGWKKQVASPI